MGWHSLNMMSTGGVPVFSNVNTFADLPPASHAPSAYFIVNTSTGIWFINRKEAGIYFSNGVTWTRLGNWDLAFRSDNFGVYDPSNSAKAIGLDPSALTQKRYIKMRDSNIDLGNVDFIQMDTTKDNPAHSEGLVFYDKNKKTLSGYTENGEVTINFGRETLIRVKNMTGATLPNGTVVYPSGASGDAVLVSMADCKYYNKSRPIGVLTCEIADGAYGEATRIGEVGGIDTTGFALNDKLYLSTTPGQLSSTPPIDGYYTILIGVVKSVAVDGVIVCDPVISEYTVETVQSLGWSSYGLPTLAFVDGTRTLTLTPTASDFHFYQYGVKYNKTMDSITIPDEEGLFYIYYDYGVMTYTKNPTNAQLDSIIRYNPTVAFIYWNATAKKAEYIGYELHRIGMGGDIHAYLHFVMRMRYLNGLALTNVIPEASGNLNTSAQFGVASGLLTDEDINFSIPEIASTIGLPIAYLLGSETLPSLRTATNSGFSVLTTGTGRLAYNQLVAGSYQLTEVPNDDFVCYHVIGVNEDNVNKRIVSFMGQVAYANVGAARLGAQTEISNLKTVGILPQEAKAIATVIFHTNNTYTNAVKARIRTTDTGASYIDWRNVQVSGSI